MSKAQYNALTPQLPIPEVKIAVAETDTASAQEQPQPPSHSHSQSLTAKPDSQTESQTDAETPRDTKYDAHDHNHPYTSLPQPPPPLVAPFFSLPAELHLQIATNLEYPDLLSRKLSHPRLFTLFLHTRQPSVHQRIAWVMRRASLGLPIPNNTGLSFKSDEAFVSNPEVKRILRERRQHRECVDALALESESEPDFDADSDAGFDIDSDSDSDRYAEPRTDTASRLLLEWRGDRKRLGRSMQNPPQPLCFVIKGNSCPKAAAAAALAQSQTQRRRRHDETETTMDIIRCAVLECVLAIGEMPGALCEVIPLIPAAVCEVIRELYLYKLSPGGDGGLFMSWFLPC